MTVESGDIPVVVSDLALAKISAQAAVAIPGVVRLAPTLTKVVHSALSRVARSLTNAPSVDHGPADPGAVEIEQRTDGPTAVTVRIIAGGDPSVLATVDAVSESVHSALMTLPDLSATAFEVIVVVVDTEPGR
ncbi:putative alkaline shock family protein YloU [Nakamurella sp. UYEF19]|uniref:hypothetical protein n=1 Tax=Nakamurella sp. UYEF19 TaxID=1756392 RepID=UPI003396478A